MQNFKKVREVCFMGLLTALVCIGTFISFPVASTNGYVNFGDGFIVIIAVFFGKKFGAVCGGIGSALADIFLGYPHWAIFTLIIKALMGYVAGIIKDYPNEKSSFISFRNLSAVFCAEIIMIVGYFIFGAILEGFILTPDLSEVSLYSSQLYFGFVQAFKSVPSNAIQAVGGGVIFVVLGVALNNAKIVRFVK